MGIEEVTMLSVEGFNHRYEENMAVTATCVAAYEATEKEFIEKYNHTRYSSYDSFKKTRSQWLKLRKAKKQQMKQAA